VDDLLDAAIERPEVEILMLVDAAEVANGKLYILGGCYDRRGVLDFRQPVIISAALAVLVPWNDTNRPIPLNIAIKTADGGQLGPGIQSSMAVGRPVNAVPGQKLRNVFTASLQAVLPGPGQYLVEAQLGDGPPKRVVFFADQVVAPGIAAGSSPR
jgi:hypothetical protein